MMTRTLLPMPVATVRVIFSVSIALIFAMPPRAATLFATSSSTVCAAAGGVTSRAEPLQRQWTGGASFASVSAPYYALDGDRHQSARYEVRRRRLQGARPRI